MANYNLVVNSKFQPFSFERYIQPYQMYGEAYKEVENALGELATKANVWEEMANEQTDPYAYQMYKKYSDDLKNQADILASQGLTPASRKALVAMKNRYSSEIDPIEKAYKKRQSLIDQQREALLRDDTLIFDTDYSTASLDTLIKNPNATFTPLSGESIAKRTAAMAKEAASAMLSDPKYKDVFNSQYVQQKIMQGYEMSQVIAAAQRDPNAPKALLGIVEAIKGQVGYDKWSKDNKGKIDSYINEGLRAAVGTPKIDVMANRNFISDLDRERMDLAIKQFELQEKQFEYESKGTKLPDGSYVKSLGGGRILKTKPDGTSEIIGSTTEEAKAEIKAQQDLEKKLSSVVKVSDMEGTGFTPVGTVINTNGTWIGGREGEDIPDWWRGYTLGTNLKSKGNLWPGTWISGSGDFSYSPRDPHAEATIVTNLDTIPGAKEWNNGTMELSDVDKSTAFGKIRDQARLAGITDEEFESKNVIILKVKATGSRASSDSPYDYIIYRKS
jgi:hypothetical protein